uniref:DNA-directed RNA polymerase n=1 Tax=Pandorina colemaniae TaxID=47786 RepID=A0A6C0RWP5_9CHLO|nr:beta subunit of RNA polymerase [Pandorina colemaniae]
MTIKELCCDLVFKKVKSQPNFNKYFITDFVAIQRKSFYTLLEKGIIEEFSKRNPITNTKKTIELFFYPNFYQLTPPKYTPTQAIIKSKSYTSKLYIPVQLTDQTIKIKKFKQKKEKIKNLTGVLKNNFQTLTTIQSRTYDELYFNTIKRHGIGSDSALLLKRQSFTRSKIIKLKWVYIGDIPLMTKRGHFILNGCARVIVNQMIRSPGIYYQKKIYENFATKWSEKPESSFTRYYADLICNRGTWLRIEMDKYNKIWAQMKRVPKIPMMWFLIAVGLTDKIVLKSIMDSKFLLYNLQEDPLNPKKKPLPYVKTPPAAWTKIYNLVFSKKLKKNTKLNKEDSITLQKTIELKSEQGRKWLFNKFMNPRTYDLGKVGRINFNTKLKLEISTNITTLTPQDFLAATNHLILVSKGFRELDDIDHLKNRRVRTSGELIQIQIGIGLVRLEKTIRDKITLLSGLSIQSFNKLGSLKKKSKNEKKTKTNTNYKVRISNIMNTKPFNGALREFFGTSPLSQFMDQINPLAELTHKRRLSSMGPGGVTRDSATLLIRGIHPSHYGRICPVETPEGKNTGLVNSLTAYARVNSEGYIETPFYRVYKGQVQKKTGLYFFSAKEEEKIKVAAPDLYTSEIGFLPNASIPVRIIEDFTKIGRNDIQYVGVAAIQMISIATSLIPFFEHDDANRALMGSNMQRQAVPILKPQRPIVGTGLEARAVSDSGHVLTAKYSGIVTYISSNKIIVYSSLN